MHPSCPMSQHQASSSSFAAAAASSLFSAAASSRQLWTWNTAVGCGRVARWSSAGHARATRRSHAANTASRPGRRGESAGSLPRRFQRRHRSMKQSMSPYSTVCCPRPITACRGLPRPIAACLGLLASLVPSVNPLEPQWCCCVTSLHKAREPTPLPLPRSAGGYSAQSRQYRPRRAWEPLSAPALAIFGFNAVVLGLGARV